MCVCVCMVTWITNNVVEKPTLQRACSNRRIVFYAFKYANQIFFELKIIVVPSGSIWYSGIFLRLHLFKVSATST